MAQTFIHKLEAKFKAGLISVDNLPIKLLQKANRHNSERGYFKNLRNKKREKICKYENNL